MRRENQAYRSEPHFLSYVFPASDGEHGNQVQKAHAVRPLVERATLLRMTGQKMLTSAPRTSLE